MRDWYQFKLFLQHTSSVNMDALHVLVGVALWILSAMVTRSSLGQWRNCVPVLLLELVNEFFDLHLETWPQPALQYGEGAKDIVLTMLLPVALTLLIQWRPRLFTVTK